MSGLAGIIIGLTDPPDSVGDGNVCANTGAANNIGAMTYDTKLSLDIVLPPSFAFAIVARASSHGGCRCILLAIFACLKICRALTAMWTTENRPRYNRDRLRYPSDLTDEEWALVEPLIPPAKRGGRRRTVVVREVVNGAMYVLSTGCLSGGITYADVIK